MYTLVLQGLCIVLWAAFILMWFRSGMQNEPKRRGTVIFPVPVLIAAFFVISFIFPFGWAFLPITAAGMLLFLFGFLWILWAKSVLGSGWSSGNMIIMGQEFTGEMPYSFVRHPFFLGILIMCAGTSLIFGSLTMVAATLVMAVLLAVNASMEENLLKEEFGQEYVEYQEETPFLLPRMVASLSRIFTRKSDDDL